MEHLVTTEWLAKEIGASDLRVVDATKFLPDMNRDARSEYEAGHIPGAIFMDLADLIDSNSDLENTVPPPEKFASRMQSLGLGDGSRIVLYDDSPLKSAARAWFLLNMFGVYDVALLDGGLTKWRAERRELQSGAGALRQRHFTVWPDNSKLRSKADMLANLDSKAELVVDARPAARFTGAEAEPRPGMAAGHIPGSCNVPHGQMFNADGTWKQGDDLRAAFTSAGVDLSRPIVTSCGSGMTGAVLLFGLRLLGKNDLALYDGSWAEWGMDPNTPKQTGASTSPVNGGSPFA